jgi:hypothetical protein
MGRAASWWAKAGLHVMRLNEKAEISDVLTNSYEEA